MNYLIRVRDGRTAGTVTTPRDPDGFAFDGETVEVFTDQAAFEARVAELTPPPEPDPSADLAARLEALAAKQSPTVKEVLAALLGTDANAAGAVAGRPT